MKKRLRITGGFLKGRHIIVPDTKDLRPVTEKIRQSFFEHIKYDLNGRNFIDAFAGTGIMGFEALSRGAAHVIFLEAKSELCSVVQQTIKSFGYQEQATVICGDILKTIERALKLLPEAICFFDPPYNDPMMPTVFNLLSNSEFSREISLIVIEHHHKHDPLLNASGWKITRSVRYGETAFTYVVPSQQ